MHTHDSTHAPRLRTHRRAPGVDRIYAPGELEFETEARYRAEGIPLNDVTLRDLATTAALVDVDVSPFGWLPA